MESVTKNLEFRLSTLELHEAPPAMPGNIRGPPSAIPATDATKDPPTSNNPSSETLPSPDDATANSRVAWAHVHHRVPQCTPPCAQSSSRRQTPAFRQTTPPGAFQPRHSSERVDGGFGHQASGCDGNLPAPGRINTTHPEASGRDGNPHAPSHVDTTHPASSSSPEAAPDVVGGPIISPCNWDMETHARTLGASQFDVICLACSKYHVGDDGVPTLTEDIIRNCGYTRLKASADEVVVCYNDIRWVHQKVRDL